MLKALPKDASNFKPRKSALAVGTILLVLACIHCAASIFFVNYSYLDLKAYAAGREKMPYQARIGMMPFLRWAEASPSFVARAHAIEADMQGRHKHSSSETMTPDKLICMALGVVSLLMSTTVASLYGLKRFAPIWWLPPALMLAMLYITQAARYESTLWYPYDLPHAAIFGTACICLLEGMWVPFFLLFLVDLPVRETSIYLASLSIAVGWGRSERKQGILAAAAIFAVWIPFRIYVGHRFAANPSELGVHLSFILNTILHPIQWPQSASAFGFMLVPLCLGNRLLSRPQRAFLLGALPCLVVTLAFGVWSETRIFGEWLLPASVLLTAEAASAIASWIRHPDSRIGIYFRDSALLPRIK